MEKVHTTGQTPHEYNIPPQYLFKGMPEVHLSQITDDMQRVVENATENLADGTSRKVHVYAKTTITAEGRVAESPVYVKVAA